MANAPIGTTAETGEECPGSGVWQIVGDPEVTAPVSQGQKMPAHQGRHVTWKLLRAVEPLPSDYAVRDERVRRG